MKTCLLVLLLSLVISGLCGVFSIFESPNEHPYNPRYDQCETFTSVPATATSIVVENLNNNPTINATVLHNTEGLIPTTIFNIAGYPVFHVFIDGVMITNYTTWGNNMYFVRQYTLGDHTMHAEWYNLIGQPQSFSFDFTVTSEDHYYQNSYANIYPATNGTSDYGAIRPVLFVEGFNAPGLISGGSSYTQSIVAKWKARLTSSKIYILSLNDPTQDARNNAMIVLGALRFIHNIHSNHLVEGTSVYGYSMGGILARYALAFAEHWGIPHYCTQYVSLDAPHRGGYLNMNMQNMLSNLESWMDDNAAYFVLGGQDPDQIDPIIESLQTVAAKQLIRNNKFAENGSGVSYGTGSTTFQEFFAEINEEERISYGSSNVLINSNPIDPSAPMKPGFPYKQNNIKSLAYSNGSLYPTPSQLGANVADYDIHIHINLPGPPYEITTSDQQSALADACDFQPGSVLDDIGARDECHQSDGGLWGHYYFNLNQHYAPTIVPTRSSLFLKPESLSGGDPIPGLAITDYGSLSQHAGSLLSHTYFDQIVYAPIVPDEITQTLFWPGTNVPIDVPHKADFNKWNWTHGELGWTDYDYDNWVASNIILSDDWLDDIQNRTVCMINGQVNGTDFSGIAGKMYINGVEHSNFSIDQNGNYQIPYIYTNDANVRLLFEKPGCLPTYRDLTLDYSVAMHQDHSVQNVSMYAFNLNNILVSNSNLGSFISIQQAIDFLTSYYSTHTYNNEAVRIRVLPGTYTESIDLKMLAFYGVTNFTLEGVGDVFLNGAYEKGIDCDMTFYGASSSVYTIKNIQFVGFETGIVFKDIATEGSDPLMVLNVVDCIFEGCGSPGENSTISAGAIHFEGAGTIRNCVFTANEMTGTYNTPDQDFIAGAVFIRNNNAGVARIEGCSFIGNSGGLTGGLAVTGTGIIIVDDNFFQDNSFLQYCEIIDAVHANSFSAYKASHTTITRNVFQDHAGTAVGLASFRYPPTALCDPLNFINNTVSYDVDINSGTAYALTFWITGGISVQDIVIRNNVFSSDEPNVCRISKGIGYHPVNVDYNIFHNVSTVHAEGFAINTQNPAEALYNFIDDPELDENYFPRWNSTIKSPCIDSGTSDLNLNGIPWYLDPQDQDPDGTRKDIGAYHNPDQHINGYHRLNNYEVKYISIPGAENHPGNEGRNTLEYVFDIYQGNKVLTADPPILDNIRWIYNADRGEATPYVIPLHYVHSQNGYKVKLLFGETLEKDIVYSGFYPGNSLNPGMYHSELNGYTTKHYITAPDILDYNCEIDDNTGVLFRKTYLGYYLPESLNPFDALMPILDDIKAIYAEDWAMVRIPIYDYPYPGDPPSSFYTDLWLGAHNADCENVAINHGEMVEVDYIGTANVEFKLGGDNPDPPFTDTYTREMAKYFYYEEQLDYLPIFISMDLNQYENGDKPTEVALFIDDECKGAAVIKDGEIQLNAYITNLDDLSDDLKEVEFRLYFPAKSASSTVTEYAVFNLQTGKYEVKTASIADFKGFLRVQIVKTDYVPIPVATQLYQNYPNPFNPFTSIRYDLAEDCLVRMDIYNVKGQHVKTLLNKEMPAGTHNVIWDGKDKQGRGVSSGVYLYRMTMPNKVLTNKMLLLK